MTSSSPGSGRTDNNDGGRGRSAMSRLLHFLAWGCIVSGSGLLFWLAFQYALLLFVFSDATHADAPLSLVMEGFLQVLLSRLALVAAGVVAIGCLLKKFSGRRGERMHSGKA